MRLVEILGTMLKGGGSDLHLTAGLRPHARIHGHLQPLEPYPAIDAQTLKTMLYSILREDQIQRFENDPDNRFELDFAMGFSGVGRFRFNYHQQRGSIGATIRALSSVIPQLEEIGLPPVIREIVEVKKGLVLVTGPTGSGKSTTLASIIDYLNATKSLHIITIEDPVEYLHNSKRSVITQREVGDCGDTMSFRNGLKYALRQDPDVILIGEMRDTQTIEIALTSAETGHLVFGTLHTSSAAQTVSRIVDVFPSDKQPLILTQLGANIEAVLSQLLLPRADGGGRVLCMEIMRANSAVRNGIRMNKIDSLRQSIQTGGQEGMTTMDQSIARLVKSGSVSYDTALPYLIEKTTVQDLEPFRKAKGAVPPRPAAPVQRPAPHNSSPSQPPAAAQQPIELDADSSGTARRQRLGQTVIPPWER